MVGNDVKKILGILQRNIDFLISDSDQQKLIQIKNFKIEFLISYLIYKLMIVKLKYKHKKKK